MSQIKKKADTTETKERTSPTGSKKAGSPSGSAAPPPRVASPTSPPQATPPSALRNSASPSNQPSSISFKDASSASSPDLRPAAQQRLATRRSLSSAISPATFSMERDLAEARNKIQHLDGECERLKHQVTNLKQDVKRSHASLFDMTSLKNQLAAQVEDLQLEKEDLRQQVLNAGMKHTLELQEMNLRVIDIQKSLEKKDAEMVNQENIVMALRAEVERLRQGGGKSQTAANRFNRQAPRAGSAESEEEVQNTHVKAIRLEMANVQLAEQVEKLQAANSDNNIAISNLRQENTTLKEEVKRMKTFIAHAGLIMPAKVKGKEEQMNSGTPTFLCIEEAKAKQQFAIERDALQNLIAEGLTLFEELYNAHRVMRRNAMDDVDKATQLWLGHNARRSSTSPNRPGGSPSRRDSSAINSSSLLGKSPEQSVNPQPKIYVMSWYKGKGAEMLQSWLAHSSNIFSPALVQALMSNGFSDMQAISKLTEEDLAAMCVTAGVRRKVLSAVDELNQKLAIVQQETQTMLRESFSLSPSYYDTKESKAEEEEVDDDNDVMGGGVPGLKPSQRRRRRKNCYAELSELLNELQNWFSDAKVAIDSQEGAVDRIFTLSTVEGENQ